MKPFKHVLLPIVVPVRDFCWDEHVVCLYFDNEGECPRCDLHFLIQEKDEEDRYPKPSECKELMD